MSTKNKHIVRRLYEEVWNERKLDVVDELISPSHALHDANISGTQIGPDAYKQQVQRLTRAFPDLQFDIEDIFSEKDKLAVSWMVSGTHQGEYEGIPPTQKKISVDGITINYLANGKILDSYVSWDALGLMRQLGHAPPLGKTIVAGGPHGLKANTISTGGVIVVYLSGAILFRESSAALRIFVKDLLNQSRQIVLDLGDVTHIDSGGLGSLVALHVSARGFGGNIKFSSLGTHANEVVRITKLVTVFEVFDKTEDAVASFSESRDGRLTASKAPSPAF